MFERARRRLGFSQDAAIEKAQVLGLTQAAKVAAKLLGEARQEGVLLPWQKDTLANLMETVCDYQVSELPKPQETNSLSVAIGFMNQTPAITRQKLLDILILFEAGSAVLSPKRQRFSKLTADAKNAYLTQWESGRVEVMCAAFQGLKSVCMIGYWSQPQTWDFIDYDLDTEPHSSSSS